MDSGIGYGIKVFGFIWTMIVIALLSVMIVVKVQHHYFYEPDIETAQEIYVNACINSEQGDENGVPDIHTKVWTCKLPVGETNSNR